MDATRKPLSIAALFGAGLAGIVLSPGEAGAIDLNGDGMSDVWQVQHGVSALDRDLDWDRDGISNYLESLFRTDPQLNGAPDESSDMFGIARLSVAGNIPTVHWPTQDGARYRIERSADMVSWMPAAQVEGNGLMAHVQPDSNPPPSGFYRVLALDPGDLDGDGLDLWEERALGSDANNPGADTDADGAHDDWEAWLFGDLDTATPTSDSDADGLADVAEYLLDLNPRDIDTDGDGRSDGAEFQAGGDPAVFNPAQPDPGPTQLQVYCPAPPMTLP